jgi:hypothetical protein
LSRHGWLLLPLLLVASTQAVQARTESTAPAFGRSADQSLPVGTPVPQTTLANVPTLVVPQQPVSVPTLAIPQPSPTPRPTATPRPTPRPTATPKPTPRPHKKKARPKRVVATATPPRQQWIWAFLTSYCPGSAGWLSASGYTVFYGMLANNYYAFGTRVYLPVIGLTGVVLDRVGAGSFWNHFDVWSPVCYGTPTGWFRVAVLN